MARTIYSPKDIYEQEFKVTMRGFDRAEVDEFLDNVINDYELFLAEIESLKAENARLKAQVKELTEQAQAHTATYSAPLMTSEYSNVTYGDNGSESMRVSSVATNFDILKRISRLELEVFGKQISE